MCVNEDRLNVVEIPINKGIDAKIQSLYTQNVPLYLLILWANLIEFYEVLNSKNDIRVTRRVELMLFEAQFSPFLCGLV